MKGLLPSISSALALTLVLGCARHDEATEKQLTDRIHDLEGQLARTHELENQVQILSAATNSAGLERQSLQQQMGQMQSFIDQLTSESAAKDARIAEQDATIEKAKAYVAKLTSRPAPAAKPALDPDRQAKADDMIHKPLNAAADLFPVSVSDARGRSVVAGTHTDWHFKKDAVQPYIGANHGSWDEDKVKDYDQVVVFSARNLTKTDKTIFVDAGRGSQSFSLGPGQSLADLSVSATKGQHLQVTCGSDSRTVAVTWP